MEEIEWKNRIVETFKHKFWIIILCMLVISGGMMTERWFRGNYVQKTGKIHVEQTIQIIPENMEDKVYLNDEYYDRLFHSYSFLEKFINTYSDNILFSKYNADWDSLSKEKQLEWLQSHIFINRFGGDLYQFVFRLGEEDKKNSEYASVHAQTFLSYFIEYSNAEVKALGSKYEFHERDTLTILPEIVQLSKKQTMMKYGIAGAILGGFVGCVIVLGIAAKRG